MIFLQLPDKTMIEMTGICITPDYHPDYQTAKTTITVRSGSFEQVVEVPREQMDQVMNRLFQRTTRNRRILGVKWTIEDTGVHTVTFVE